MNGFGLNQNIAAMNAQRQLGIATIELNRSYTRLSTGLRINQAADDAAGLAIASGLSVDSRVYTTAIRNVNDGIGMMSIAEGALTELSSVITRIREVTAQSANGTLGLSQRKSIQAEADALQKEFNRITASTTFNGLNLLDGSLSNISLQLGYGDAGSLQVSMGQSLGIQANTGTFSSVTTLAAGGVNAFSIFAEDFNNDGNTDLIQYGVGTAEFFAGNGDGTFKAFTSFAYSGTEFGASGDLNNDGRMDIITSTGSSTFILLGNGDGTFRSSSFTNSVSSVFGSIVDMNGDKIPDVVVSAYTGSVVDVNIGRGDGTFLPTRSFSTGSSYSSSTADVNGDGKMDVLLATNAGFSVLLGNGDGTLKAERSNATAIPSRFVTSQDLNFDGINDIVSAAWSTGQLVVNIGNGDGSFKAHTAYATNVPIRKPYIKDMNGDGFVDVVAVSDAPESIVTVFGNGDGTFKAPFSSPVAPGAADIAIFDSNGNGSLEVAVANASVGALQILNPNTQIYTGLARVNLLTKESAKSSMAVLEYAARRITSELGRIGANSSRADSARNNLSIIRENYVSAASQITDVDVAEESSRLVRLKILQSSAQAILQNANKLPGLVLSLLRN